MLLCETCAAFLLFSFDLCYCNAIDWSLLFVIIVYLGLILNYLGFGYIRHIFSLEMFINCKFYNRLLNGNLVNKLTS